MPDALDQFSIPVSGLRNGLHAYDFSIRKPFFEAFEESPIEDGAVEVHFSFDKRTDLYEMQFELTGTVKVVCDRCLDEFNLPIEDNQVLLVKFDEKPWEDADVIYLPQDTQRINVAKYIYEFINLAVPIAKTHDDADLDCNPDMLKFLGTQEMEDDQKQTPIWDALKNLDSNDN